MVSGIGEDFYDNVGDKVAKSEAAQEALERPINYDALRKGKSSDIVIASKKKLT